MSSTTAGLLQLGVLLLLLAAAYVPFGNYMAGVYSDDKHWRVERAVYRVVRVDPDADQRWTGYAAALLAFSFLSVVLLYLLQRLQGVLPLSLGRGAVDPGIAFNTAVLTYSVRLLSVSPLTRVRLPVSTLPSAAVALVMKVAPPCALSVGSIAA